MANQVVPLGDVKQRLNIASSVSKFDDELDSICDGIVTWFESQTDRQMDGVETIVYFANGNGLDRMWLHDPPVAFTSVEERDEPSLKTFTVIDAADYEQDERQLFRIAGTSGVSQVGLWPRGRRNLKMTYTAGYTSTTFPRDLKQAVLAVIAKMWSRKTDPDMKREELGDYEIEFFQAAREATVGGMSVASVLARYTNISKN